MTHYETNDLALYSAADLRLGDTMDRSWLEPLTGVRSYLHHRGLHVLDTGAGDIEIVATWSVT